MNVLKRILILGVCLVLLLAGCGQVAESSDQSSTDSGSSIQSTVTPSDETSSDVSSDDVSSNQGSSEDVSSDSKGNSYEGVDREVLGSKDKLKTDLKPLPDIENLTEAQLAKCMISAGTKVSMTKDAAYKAKDAKAAIKFEFLENRVSGQAIFAEKLAEKLPNGLDEAIVLDPVDGSLEGYEGIRYYVKVKRPEGKAYSEMKMRFFFGSYSYYRSMYEYTTVLPDGDFEGYIYVPFNEMVSGYDTSKKAVSIANIAYFAFNVQLEGNIQGTEVYVSDFAAYREMYW